MNGVPLEPGGKFEYKRAATELGKAEMVAARNSGDSAKTGRGLEVRNRSPWYAAKKKTLSFFRGPPQRGPELVQTQRRFLSVCWIWKMIGKKWIGVEDVIAQNLPCAAMKLIAA